MGLLQSRRLWLLVAALLLASTTSTVALAATAATSDAPATSSLPKPLQGAVKSGKLQVIKSFSTEVPGLTGYVLAQSGQHEIVYGDNGYLIVGRVISPQGDDLTPKYEAKYVPKPDLSSVVEKLQNSQDLIQQGPANAPLIYVFADPNCIFCHRFYEQAEPLVKAGKIQLKWVLVGFLKPSSPGRAAAILSAKNPAQALVRNENGFNDSKEEGGITPEKNISDAMQKQLKAHADLMASAGGTGTPTLIYQTASGWTSKVGAPGTAWLKTHIVQSGQDQNGDSKN